MIFRRKKPLPPLTSGVPGTELGEIMSARVEPHHEDPKRVHIQYVAKDGPRELILSFHDAMYLLAALRAIQIQTGQPFPEDPWKR